MSAVDHNAAYAALKGVRNGTGAAVSMEQFGGQADGVTNCTDALVAAIARSQLIAGEHKRAAIVLGPGDYLIDAGDVIVPDIEGASSNTRGKLLMVGAGRGNSNLIIQGNGDGLTVKSGRVTLRDFSIKSAGVSAERGYNGPTITNVSAISRTSNVTTVTTDAAHGGSVGDTVVVAGVTDTSFRGKFTIASVPTSTSFTYANTGSNGSSASGTAHVLHVAGTGWGLVMDPTGDGAGSSTPGWVVQDVECSYHPTGGAYLWRPEQGRFEGLYASFCGGVGIKQDGVSGGASAGIGNTYVGIRSTFNAGRGVDVVNGIQDTWIAPTILSNYGDVQMRTGSGGRGTTIITPDIEAQTIPVTSGGSGCNTYGIDMSAQDGMMINGMVDAGGIAPIKVTVSGVRLLKPECRATSTSPAEGVEVANSLANLWLDITLSNIGTAFSTHTKGTNSVYISNGAAIYGAIQWRPSASVTPANNGDLAVEATSNTSLTFKLKGSDGTVRSGSITLS